MIYAPWLYDMQNRPAHPLCFTDALQLTLNDSIKRLENRRNQRLTDIYADFAARSGNLSLMSQFLSQAALDAMSDYEDGSAE